MWTFCWYGEERQRVNAIPAGMRCKLQVIADTINDGKILTVSRHLPDRLLFQELEC